MPNKNNLGCSAEDKIGFEKESDQTASLTQDGDCGALYLDLMTGVPVAMHHAMNVFDFPGTDEPDAFESYGFPLSMIMTRHLAQFGAQMFGTIEPSAIGGSEQDRTNTSVQQPGAALGCWH